jgi:signal recognition particle GTPase
MREVALAESIRRMESWLRSQQIRAAQQTESDTHELYAKLAEHFLTGDTAKESTEQLAESLKSLQERNDAMAQFGLMPHANIQLVIDILNEAPMDKRDILSQILKPYVDGFKKRLATQQETFEVVERFVSRLNSFLRDKFVVLHARAGLQVFPERSRMTMASMMNCCPRFSPLARSTF